MSQSAWVIVCAVVGACGSLACAGELRFEDRSADLLPIEMTQGRSMDAEVVRTPRGSLLVIASEFGQNVAVVRADGGWSGSVNVLPRGRLHDSEDIAAADFDGDGRTDLVFVSEDDQTNELYLGAEDGGFVDASDRLPAPGGVTNAVLAHDIDSDGDADLILGNRGANVVLMNDGEGNFSVDGDRIPADARTTQDLELADVDGDGDQDMIAANEDGNRLLINDGSGVFTDETEARLPGLDAMGTMETREADFFDADGDGDVDLFFANVGWRPGANPTNRLLLNDGEGVFTEAEPGSLPAATFFTLDADAADLDGDGDLDLVLGNVQGPPVQVWMNDGAGVFTDVTTEAVPSLQIVSTTDVEVVDLDGDGRLDIYVANHAGPDRALVSAER